MAQGAVINGTLYSYANIQVIMLGAKVDGIIKISYDRTLKADPVYASGQEIYGYGYGNYTYTASIELLTEEWRKISLAAGGNPLSLAPFNISILFLPSENGIIFPFTDVLYNCQFLKDGLSSSSGDTSIKVDIPLMISGFARFN